MIFYFILLWKIQVFNFSFIFTSRSIQLIYLLIRLYGTYLLHEVEFPRIDSMHVNIRILLLPQALIVISTLFMQTFVLFLKYNLRFWILQFFVIVAFTYFDFCLEILRCWYLILLKKWWFLTVCGWNICVSIGLISIFDGYTVCDYTSRK